MNSVASDAIVGLLRDAVQSAKNRRRLPTATYRLQMHAGFTLKHATAIAPYLDRLGISHLYMSSLLTARPGSLHGYDVVNHGHLNPELGTDDDLMALVTELHRRDMGLILDVVPNHMCVCESNEWWMDVLENGPASRFAGYFDIAWRDHPRERLRGKVLLPILDEPYGKVMKAGRLRPFFENGRFGITIDQMRLPLDPRTYAVLLEPALVTLREKQGEDASSVLELQSILTAIRHLPSRDDPDSQHVTEALAEEVVIKRRLRDLADQHPEVGTEINHAVHDFGSTEENPANLARLIELLEAQPYRPSFWRVALDEINYRRFFDVNDLAALAAERTDVFRAVHVKPFEWLRKGILDGLRIDHVDGLLDPKEYLTRLQQSYVLGFAQDLWEANPSAYGGTDWSEVESQLRSMIENGAEEEDPALPGPLLYVVVEKILGLRESLPANWDCDGTTGYEFLNEVNRLFVDPQCDVAMTAAYQQFTKQTDSFEQVAFEKKLQILRSTMASELHVLAHRLDRLAQMEWWSRDFTLNGLRNALEVMIANFPVYRTYVTDEPASTDRMTILRAALRARRNSPFLGREIFEFICDTLLLREPKDAPVSSEYHDFQRQFAGKFQQLTSPVMAKGVEDTSFYTFNRLISLNEVGGDPSKFGSTPKELHTFFQNRISTVPFGLSALSTHDTKRSEDVRAQLNVLSEIPAEWGKRIDHWRQLNRSFKVELDEGVIAPDENEEYLLYQTLIGSWPGQQNSTKVDYDFINRIQAYMTKAIREAKVNSSWIYPETKYDDAISSFIASILNEESSAEFLADLRDFQSKIQPIGQLNSLSQTLIRCIAPGIPDIYQGCDSWDYSLVDPDNRRPVDYGSHNQILERLEQFETTETDKRIGQLRQKMRSNESKLFVTSKALRFRREHIELVQSGQYLPLEITGSDAEHLFGFILADAKDAVLVTVPRLVSGLNLKGKWDAENMRPDIDADVLLPDAWASRNWFDVLAGKKCHHARGTLPAKALLEDFPVALFHCHAES